jgi:hypothetical protein
MFHSISTAQNRISNPPVIAPYGIPELVVDGKYNFIGQPERLVYIGENWSGNGYWHQFEKVSEAGVWCEMQDAEISLLEATKDDSVDGEYEEIMIFGGIPQTVEYKFHAFKPHSTLNVLRREADKKDYQHFVKRNKRAHLKSR